MSSRLHEKYRKDAVPALTKRFGYTNTMAVPRVSKVTVNIGLGEASQNVKLLDTAAAELGQIAGQKPVITRAKKSIANFKIRKGMPIGCMVTLARRANVRISRPAFARSFFRACATSRACRRIRSTAAEITRWD